jgi:LysM repeat protein
MNNIGFIVWGIRNGFKNNWLSANVSPNVYERFTDDMRQICNSTVDKFFSIEKIEEFTVLSIFNPNTKDHVQRKAYIALSIVIPNGYVLQGDVIGCLQSMMKTYEVKQGNAMVNMVSAEDMNMFLKQLQLSPNPNSVAQSRTKIGLFQYNDLSEISSHFQDPSIYEFIKVFFTSSQNVALDRVAGIQHVQSFSKPLFLTISGFNPNAHRVSINNHPITTDKVQVKQGDVVQFVELKSKQAKQLQVGASDVHVSMLEVFPPVIIPPKPPKPGGNKKIKLIGLLAVVFIILGGAAFFLLPPATEQPFIDDPAPVAKTMTAMYDFETLKLQNIPKDADSTFGFIVFKLTNDTIPIDSLTSLNPVSKTAKLKKVSDTVILVEYQIVDSIIRMHVPVEFKVPSTYKIKSGETLSVIAERFDIKKDSLMTWNDLKNENEIKEGQKLKFRPETVTVVQKEVENPKPINNAVKDEINKAPEKPREQPKPTETSTPAATATKKDNSNDLTPLKIEANKLIKELKNLGVDITVFEDTIKSCPDETCLKSLIEEMENKISNE